MLLSVAVLVSVVAHRARAVDDEETAAVMLRLAVFLPLAVLLLEHALAQNLPAQFVVVMVFLLVNDDRHFGRR